MPRDPAEHRALVSELQADYLADDLEPPAEATEWSRIRLAQWFEAGGQEAHVPQPAMEERLVTIPRAQGGPLNGKLLAQGKPTFVLVWASANPGKKFGSEHMDSAVPSAVAEECRRTGVALLRFDYSGVRGSGGGGAYDESQPYHPHARSEFSDAVAFLRDSGCHSVAVGGHSMGASAMCEAAADADVEAIVSCGTGPLVYKFMPPAAQADVRDGVLRDVCAFPVEVPKLFIVGANDVMSPAVAMEALIQGVEEPKSLEVVPGCAHNFEGKENELAARIVQFAAQVKASVGSA
jgi:alpha/beta superfamily hydrolase